MSYTDILKAQLLVDEGSLLVPYVDSVGKISIGIGRNLTDVGISEDERDLMFAHDLNRAVALATHIFPTFNKLSDNRKAVVCNMAFNLGNKLKGFIMMIAAVNMGNFDGASEYMMQSVWAKQVGNRAKRLSKLMREG